MSQEEFPREDELESRQGGGLYPVGRALRATYDAENHDSLGQDLTGLMLELARIDPDGTPGMKTPAVPPQPSPAPAAEPPAPAAAAVPWWRRWAGRGR